MCETGEEFERKCHKLGPTDKSNHSGHNNTSDMDLKYTLYGGVIHKAYICILNILIQRNAIQIIYEIISNCCTLTVYFFQELKLMK